MHGGCRRLEGEGDEVMPSSRATDDELAGGAQAHPAGEALQQLMIAAANQLELWAGDEVCDEFRREYLIELVAELRGEADGIMPSVDAADESKSCRQEV
jgi:hypothetical protein